MAQFLVRNSLNPHKVAKLGITFTKLATKEDMTGDERWVIEIGTQELGTNGNSISPTYINAITLDNIDEEIAKAVSIIASKIDWGEVLSDNRAPFVYSSNINSYLIDIDSYLELKIKEYEPSSGIDKDSIKLTVNDIDATSDLFIDGTPFDYTVYWYPRQRVRSTFI